MVQKENDLKIDILVTLLEKFEKIQKVEEKYKNDQKIMKFWKNQKFQ